MGLSPDFPPPLDDLPQATVQAALATAPLDIIYRTYLSDSAWLGQCSLEDSAYRGEAGFEEFCRYERWGQDIIATAIFSIILTAPPGLLIIAKLGPKWLTKVSSATSAAEPSTLARSAIFDLHESESIMANDKYLIYTRGIGRWRDASYPTLLTKT